MRIAVINGTEKKGVTFQLKEKFLEPFRDNAEIIEFYLPKDCHAFCAGCTTCFIKGENNCRNIEQIKPIRQTIENADLLVFTTPAYVMHATGAMKSLLDHMAFRWMPHRPHPAMFSKRAVIISQCLGAGAKQAAKDIKDSLSWWGISKIKIFTTRLLSDIIWDNLPQKKQRNITKKVRKLSIKFARINYKLPAHTKFKTKLKFYMCRMIQKSIRKKQANTLDCKYWTEQGWLAHKRPWKR
ncbi:MAG: NAD(P)H-dependent oxidoreductase [Anaeroplasmataceae bacterium]|nr:NAD(P)H-dependent oxidoreductase [Anaeroplasmataceae bacterium]